MPLSVIPAPIFIGINSSRNPVFSGSYNSLDSRSPIDTFEDKFHGNDALSRLHNAFVSRRRMDVNEGRGLCKMAGDPVAFFDLAEGWNLFLAVFHTDGTS